MAYLDIYFVKQVFYLLQLWMGTWKFSFKLPYYMAYYRNREAFQLFHEHSTHLRKEQEKHQVTNRVSKRKRRKGQEAPHAIKASPRDPLLDYKRPRLVELLHEARDERDKAKRQARAKRAEIEQRAQSRAG